MCSMLKIHNTLTKNVQPFKPAQDKKVNLFVCGITPYDFPHIGHAKTYVQFDIIVRYLRYRGYDVFYLQNVTDIDDKIIQRAAENKESWKELSLRYEKVYLSGMDSLNVNSVSRFARATEYIPQIIAQVRVLLEKGVAYEIEDGIYYDLSKFSDYGKLSGRMSIEAQDAVSRIDDNSKKRNKGDFCLWKRSKPGEPVWNSPWFPGRPGWHIEDTAITETFLGPQYDVHGGAQDLIFPHHEAEIAQQEAASGKVPFVRYWLHTGFLNVNGQKMSKSLGNFITIKDALARWGAMPLRFLFATTHYRSPINFSDESLVSAKNGYEKLQNTLIAAEAKRNSAAAGGLDNGLMAIFLMHKKKFIKEMDNDFNTPKAAAELFEMVYVLNTATLNKKTLEKAMSVFKELTDILGIVFETRTDVPSEVQKLVELREEARKSKNFAESDRLREEIKKKGFSVDDTEHGAVVRKDGK